MDVKWTLHKFMVELIQPRDTWLDIIDSFRCFNVQHISIHQLHTQFTMKQFNLTNCTTQLIVDYIQSTGYTKTLFCWMNGKRISIWMWLSLTFSVWMGVNAFDGRNMYVCMYHRQRFHLLSIVLFRLCIFEWDTGLLSSP